MRIVLPESAVLSLGVSPKEVEIFLISDELQYLVRKAHRNVSGRSIRGPIEVRSRLRMRNWMVADDEGNETRVQARTKKDAETIAHTRLTVIIGHYPGKLTARRTDELENA
jgi:hypothetical protein